MLGVSRYAKDYVAACRAQVVRSRRKYP